MIDYLANSPRLSGTFWALAGAALLLWEWLRDRGPGPWLPGHGHILAIICAPVFILLGLASIVQGSRTTGRNGLDNRRHFVIGIALGFVNAYFLGVWRSISANGIRQLFSSWWWVFIVTAAIAAVLILRRRTSSDKAGPDQT